MFTYRDKQELLNNNKEFQELHASIESFTSMNIDSIYVNTKSFDYRKYIILLRQIIKKRLETKKITRVNFVTKEIEVKRKDLTEIQLKALEWLLNNNDYLVWKTEKLVKEYENGKIFKGSIKNQIDKYNAKHGINDKYQEILKYFDEE